MKKNLIVYLLLAVVLFIPAISLAQAPGCSTTFCNPAGDFLIDLTRPGINGTNTFAGLLTYIIRLLLSIVGLISIAFIVIGGFQYITSRGDEEAASAGKKTLTNAIIGLVIVILSYVMVVVIMNGLQGKI
ncbi:MAG: pilin [Candidatus Doudnabacteria bacterium]|nr:pilin [Candidatus Doudnabacteria bacterium]